MDRTEELQQEMGRLAVQQIELEQQLEQVKRQFRDRQMLLTGIRYGSRDTGQVRGDSAEDQSEAAGG